VDNVGSPDIGEKASIEESETATESKVHASLTLQAQVVDATRMYRTKGSKF
jgi:hypothetical protein